MIGQMFPLYEAHAAQLTLYLMIGQMFPLYEAHAAQLTGVGPQLRSHVDSHMHPYVGKII